MNGNRDTRIAILITLLSLFMLCISSFHGLDFGSSERHGGIDDSPAIMGGIEPVGSRAAEYMDAEIIGDDEFYAGDQEKEFTIFVRENYGGEEFDDTEGGAGNDSFNNYNTFDTTVVIRDFRDENGKQISGTNNPFVGFMSGHSNAYNGEDGDGYMVRSSSVWYAGEDNEEFQPNVKKTVIPGEYTLSLVINYKIRLAWDPVDETYDYSTRADDKLIPVEIKSGLGVQSETEIEIYDKNDNPGATLYAGAKYQKIGVTDLSSDVGDVGSLEGTLTFTGNDITVPEDFKKARKDEQGAWPFATLFWRVDVKEGAAPQFYDVRLTLSYTRNWDDGDDDNDMDVTENAILLKIAIGFTPVLSPPDSNELAAEITEIDQEGNGKADMEVTFSNRGNVDLLQIEVWLDLSNARYFYTSDFYYDEDDFALKKDIGTEKSIESLGKGQSTKLNFQVSVRNDIPPGKYIIPIKYTALYMNSGVFGGSTIDEETTEVEYRTIMTAQGAKEPDDKAYIFLRIEDTLLDMKATTPNRLQPGMVEANLRVNLQNVDGYDLTQMNVTIKNDPNLPIFPVGGMNSFEEHLFDTLNSGWMTNLDFVVNVDEKAPLRIHNIPVVVQYRNELEEDGRITVYMELEIIPVPPELVVARVETSVIEEEEGFGLDVVLMNIGGSKASNVSALLIDNNNEFESGSSDALETSESFDLAPGETKKISYKLTTQSIDLGRYYNLSVRVQYKDSKGNLIRYSQNEPLPVLLKTDGESTMNAATMRDWTYLILGILFLVVLCLLPLIFYKIHYGVWKKKEKKRGEIARKGDKKETKDKKEKKADKPTPPLLERKADTPRPLTAGGHAPLSHSTGARPSGPLSGPSLPQQTPTTHYMQPDRDVPRPPNVPYGAYDKRMLPEHK